MGIQYLTMNQKRLSVAKRLTQCTDSALAGDGAGELGSRELMMASLLGEPSDSGSFLPGFGTE